MTTPRLWPNGAAFLHALCILARGWCAGAKPTDHHRVFHTLRAEGERSSAWDGEMDLNAQAEVDISGLVGAERARVLLPSAHVKLQAETLRLNLAEGIRSFVVDGARLPGVGCRGFCPGFLVEMVGDGDPQGAFVLHDAGGHPDVSWRQAQATARLYPFDRKRSMEDAAEAFLDAVDTLVRHAPQPGDPSWVFAHPAGQYKERLDWIGGPVEAPDEAAALAVARVVLKSAKDTEGLMAFQRPTVEGILPVRKFRFADTQT